MCHPASVMGPQARVRTYVLRGVTVVEAQGQLGDIADDLDLAIQLALAEGPRGVVCDLSSLLEGAGPVAIEALAAAGRHARVWSGIPVVVAGAEPQVRAALAAHPLGGRLVLAQSLFSAVTAVLATPVPNIERLRLAPHPTAPRASRDFVTRTLLDWRLGRTVPHACLVVSELVSRSIINAGTDLEVSVSWDLGALRLTVRDHGLALAGQQPDPDLHGGEPAVVSALARAVGVTPTADGGKVAWAVLEAPRTLPSTGLVPSGEIPTSQRLPLFTDARGLAGMPFCAGSSLRPTTTRRGRLPRYEPAAMLPVIVRGRSRGNPVNRCSSGTRSALRRATRILQEVGFSRRDNLSRVAADAGHRRAVPSARCRAETAQAGTGLRTAQT